MLKLFQENESAMVAALAADLHKPELEGVFEVAGLIKNIQFVIKEFRKWAEPELVIKG